MIMNFKSIIKSFEERGKQNHSVGLESPTSRPIKEVEAEREMLAREKYPVEWKTVTGYKAVKKDLHSFRGDYLYNLNEVNIHVGPIEMCESGLHFCPKLLDLGHYVNIFEARIFEVTAVVDVNMAAREREAHPYERIVGYSDKLVAKSMTFVRELSSAEIYYSFAKDLRKEYGLIISTFQDFEAIRFNVDGFWDFAEEKVKFRLAAAGYSETFAGILKDSVIYYNKMGIRRINNKLFELAIAYAEENVSPDMRAYLLSKKME